jgi:hypothetical protein
MNNSLVYDLTRKHGPKKSNHGKKMARASRAPEICAVIPPTCPYCNAKAALVTGKELYPFRADLHDKKFYRCSPCQAHVGCHPGTLNPLGRLANAELRRAKMAAHEAFDPLWKSGQRKRASAYAWLAERLGIDKKDCHIGLMDIDMCRRVVEVCRDE